MNLEVLAETHTGAAGRAAVAEWVAGLRNDSDGLVIFRHLNAEENLPTHPEGLAAVRRLVAAIVLPPAGKGVGWYLTTIRDMDLACKGPHASGTLPTDLCKVARGLMVWNRLRKVSAPDDTPVLPPGSTRLTEWLRDIVCSPAYLEALDPSRLVSAPIPAVFSAFEQDRQATFPAGSPAARCWQSVGVDPPDPPQPCVLLKYVKEAVGPARVPSAFDAGTHPHFLPAAGGAGYGVTKNLGAPGGGGGVREVVVPPFQVAQLREPEFIGA